MPSLRSGFLTSMTIFAVFAVWLKNYNVRCFLGGDRTEINLIFDGHVVKRIVVEVVKFIEPELSNNLFRIAPSLS